MVVNKYSIAYFIMNHEADWGQCSLNSDYHNDRLLLRIINDRTGFAHCTSDVNLVNRFMRRGKVLTWIDNVEIWVAFSDPLGLEETWHKICQHKNIDPKCTDTMEHCGVNEEESY